MKWRIGAAVFIVLAAAAVMFVQPLLRHPIVLWSLAPVTNSWGSPRPGGRGHQGVDIFAARAAS